MDSIEDAAERVLEAYRERHRFDTEFRAPSPRPPPEEGTGSRDTILDYMIDQVPDDVRDDADTLLDAMQTFYRYDSPESVADAAFDIATADEHVDEEQRNSRWEYCPECLDAIAERISAGDDPEEIDMDPRLDRKYTEGTYTHGERFRWNDTARKQGWLTYRCSTHEDVAIKEHDEWIEEGSA